MLISSALTACNNETEDVNVPNNHLKVNFGVATPQSRAVITGNNLVDGSLVGVTVVDAIGTDYQGADYNNVCYTAATVDGKQQWTPDRDVTLSGEPATLYAYYPWTDGIDVGAIPVDMTEDDQTDWMYATPVEGLNDANATAQVKLHHALANVKLTVYKEGYSGAGQLSDFTLTSDAFATGGTLNAKTGLFTAYTGEGAAFARSVDYTLTDKASATPFDCMVVPTGTNAAMTVTVTVDGHTYSSTTSALTLAKATAYNLALKLTSTGLSVTSVSLTDWSEAVLPDADFEPVISDPWANVPNGVYAVAADGSPVEVANATAECIAVALIVNDAPTPQRLMIEKTEEYHNEVTTFYWGKNLYGKDVSGITNFTTIDGTIDVDFVPNHEGILINPTSLSVDYTTWTKGAFSDFNGEENTLAIIAAYTEHDVEMHEYDMCKVLQDFNESSSNLGYYDWYIPACGQLALIQLNMSEINKALTQIGGKCFFISMGGNNTSSEYDADYFWLISNDSGIVAFGDKDIRDGQHVRFVRDIN